MQAKAFFAGIRAIHVAFHSGRKSTMSLTFLWMTVDSSVKRDVTDEMWAHACKELITNWNPEAVINRPIHIQVLSYLYRQRDGAPAFDWGMKEEICKQFSACQLWTPSTLCLKRKHCCRWRDKGYLKLRIWIIDNFLGF